MVDEPTGWRLVRFGEAIEAWIQRENPPDDLRLVVVDWLMNRHADPYQGMRREVDLPNLWYGKIPNTETGWSAVVCSYWIYERTRVVRCNMIGTLDQPN